MFVQLVVIVTDYNLVSSGRESHSIKSVLNPEGPKSLPNGQSINFVIDGS